MKQLNMGKRSVKLKAWDVGIHISTNIIKTRCEVTENAATLSCFISGPDSYS